MDDYESIALEELRNVGESEIISKSNGVCHVEDVNEGIGSSSSSVNNRRLRKWRRIPRELVRNPGSNINGRNNTDLSNSLVRNSVVNVNGNSGLVDQSLLATRADSENSEDQNSRSSRTRPKISNSNGGNSAISIHSGDQKINGQTGTSKKPRGVKIEKENSDSNIGKFVFLQENTSVANKSKQSGNSVKYDEEYKLLNNEAESEDVKQEDEIAKESFDQNALVESITSLDSAVEELEKEVQKWKDIGKDELLTFDDSINDILEVKDAMIMKLESALISGDTKNEIDDLLKEKIQADVEIVAITTTTKSLITGPLNEMKLNLQENSEKLETKEDVKKMQNKALKKHETEEDVKKLKNRVRRLSLCLMIQLILMFVTFYLELSCENKFLVPT